MSNDLKEAFVAALQSQKAVLCRSQTGFCPSFYCEKDRWKDSCQLFQEWAAQQIHPKDRPCNAQRLCKTPKSCTGDSTGFSQHVKCQKLEKTKKKRGVLEEVPRKNF